MSKAMADNGRKWKKAMLSGLAGAVFGAGTVALMMWLAGDGLLEAMGPSRVILAGVGLIYLLVTMMIGFGLAAPRAGAKLLNVDDAEELVDDRPKLLGSALYMGLAGLTLILISLAQAPGFANGPIVPGIAVAALAILLIASILSFRWLRVYDEFDRQLGIEGGSWAFLIACAILLPWGMLDALGWAVPLSSIDVISVLAASLIGGSFAAVGARGMMVR